jgi:hypothetical protein
MPCIAAQYNPRVGPLLQLSIFAADIRATQGTPILRDRQHIYMALLDTGASSTCVSRKVVEEVGLRPTGKMPVIGVHGSTPTNTYQFTVGFIVPQGQDATGALLADLTMFAVDGIEFANVGCGFDVLLGRDVLCRGQFTMTFNGQFVICF